MLTRLSKVTRLTRDKGKIWHQGMQPLMSGFGLPLFCLWKAEQASELFKKGDEEGQAARTLQVEDPPSQKFKIQKPVHKLMGAHGFYDIYHLKEVTKTSCDSQILEHQGQIQFPCISKLSRSTNREVTSSPLRCLSLVWGLPVTPLLHSHPDRWT